MDANDLAKTARTRFDHAASKRVIKEKYEAKMLFGYRGGMWRAGPLLQITLTTCTEPEAVLLDLYDNPINIDVKELLTLSQQRWQEQMNAWLHEYNSIMSQR